MKAVSIPFLCRLTAGILLFSGSGTVLFADDAQAQAKFSAGEEAFAAESYKKAAELFIDAEQLADSVPLKANAVLRAVDAYKEAGLRYREYECIEKLLTSYNAISDYSSLVERQFEIGNEFYNGYRDPAFPALSFIPWLTDNDKTVEICTRALEHAPFAKAAPATQLRLAVRLIDERQLPEAAEMLRQFLKRYEDAPERKIAYLRLGSVLYAMALNGDGDGSAGREAQHILQEFLQRYPGASERSGVERLLVQIRDAEAQRLKEIADFYHRNGRDSAAAPYLVRIIREFPDTNSAADAEQLLSEIDRTYIPEQAIHLPEERLAEYPDFALPDEGRGKLLIAPESSNGKYLLPVYDTFFKLPEAEIASSDAEEAEAETGLPLQEENTAVTENTENAEPSGENLE